MSYGLLSGATLCVRSASYHVRDPACTHNEWSVLLQWEFNEKGLTGSHDRSNSWTVNQINVNIGKHTTIGYPLWHMHTHTISSHACYQRGLAIPYYSPNCLHKQVFLPSHTPSHDLFFFTNSPVVVTPEKTQHCPYDTGVPLEEWYFLRISTLLLHAAGDTPSE